LVYKDLRRREGEKERRREGEKERRRFLISLLNVVDKCY
jgi:hypothetical protein